jgi:hypothetical protein
LPLNIGPDYGGDRQLPAREFGMITAPPPGRGYARRGTRFNANKASALRPPRRTRRTGFMGSFSKMRLARLTAVRKPVVLEGCDKNAICSKEGGKKGTVNRRFRCSA